MITKKLFDTSLPKNYSKGLLEEHTCTLLQNHTDKIVDVTFTATATFLAQVKSKDHAAVLRFDRNDGSMVAAGIVRYFEGEGDDPGYWNLVFTFYEEDIPEGANVMSIQNTQCHTFFRSIAGSKYRFTFSTPGDIIVLPTYFFEQLRKWLDENAVADDEVEITLPGVMKARVAIEGGEKVFAIEPEGEIKMLIKDDNSEA